MSAEACLLIITFLSLFARALLMLMCLKHKAGTFDLILSVFCVVWIVMVCVRFLFNIIDSHETLFDVGFSIFLFAALAPLFVESFDIKLFVYLSACMFSVLLNSLCGYFAATLCPLLSITREETAVLLYLMFIVSYYLIIQHYISHAVNRLCSLIPGRSIRILSVYPVIALIVFAAGLSLNSIELGEGLNTAFELLFMLMVIAVYILIVKSLLDVAQRKEAENELEFARHVVLEQKNSYNRQLQNWENMKRLRHDFLHHMQALSGMDSIERVKVYVGRLMEGYQLVPQKPFAEHKSVNAIMSWYADQCEKNGITLSTQLDIPQETQIDELDLCVVIGNLMQNALEANQRLNPSDDKYIHFRARMVEGKLMMMIENSFDGTVKKNGEKIVSRKKSGGLGLVGIRRIMAAPGNDIETYYSENVFTVLITLSAPVTPK